MSLFGALMDRLAQGDAGMLSDVWSSFAASSRPLEVKRWESWARAEQARARGDASRSSQWLNVAFDLGEQDPAEDMVWTAEASLTAGRLLESAGEPGQAFEHLIVAFNAWRSVLDSLFAPLRGEEMDLSVGKSVEAFTRVLVGDERHDIDPGSPQVMAAWMQERFVPGLVGAGSSLVRVAADSGGTETAEGATEALLGILPQIVDGKTLRIFIAEAHRDLGNHYQQTGRFKDAVHQADLALVSLQPISGDPDVTKSIAHLKFNRANGLARSGREADAIAIYNEIEAVFTSAGDTEAALRTRYARLHLMSLMK